MNKLLLTCFLALLCLVGRYLAASSKVADSPTEKSLHRSDLPAEFTSDRLPVSYLEAGLQPVSPHSGDDHREGETLPDNFLANNFGLINVDQDMRVGMEKEYFHSTSVPVLSNQDFLDQETKTETLNSESLASLVLSEVEACFLCLASSFPAPVTVSAPPVSKVNHQMNQFSLEISGDEGSKLAPHSRGLLTVDGGPSLPSSVSSLLSNPSTSQGQEEGNTPAQVGEFSLADSLQIGDLVPDHLVFTNLLNTEADRIKLSDYRGKYVILQFWATWCTASSGFLIQAEEIQNHFGDQLQVLPVTYESKTQVEKALSIRKSLGDLTLPLVTQEDKLRAYFPHITLPHLVIIDPEGKVIAITESKDLSIPKLQTLIDTGEGSFRLKVDHRIPFDMDDKLISGNTQIPSKNIRFQSALTNYIPGVSGGSTESFEDGTHLLFVNISLIKLYRHAYTGRDIENYLGFNRIITEGFDAEELTTTKSGLDYREWMERGDRVFGYELLAPPNVDGYAQMREDLNRYFPRIAAKIEQRPRMVWALVQQEGKVYPKSKSAKSYQVQPGQASLRNSLLTGFIYQLNLYFMQRSPYPVINRTGIDYPIDIDLEANFSKPEELKEALNKVGLDLILREETIPVLILTKNLNPIYP